MIKARTTVTFNNRALAALKASPELFLTRFAEQFRATAKVEAPFKEGTLRRSIDTKVHGHEGVLFTECGYGGYQEFGTRRHAANPFCARSFQLTANRSDKIADEVRRETERAAI